MVRVIIIVAVCTERLILGHPAAFKSTAYNYTAEWGRKAKMLTVHLS